MQPGQSLNSHLTRLSSSSSLRRPPQQGLSLFSVSTAPPACLSPSSDPIHVALFAQPGHWVVWPLLTVTFLQLTRTLCDMLFSLSLSLCTLGRSKCCSKEGKPVLDIELEKLDRIWNWFTHTCEQGGAKRQRARSTVKDLLGQCTTAHGLVRPLFGCQLGGQREMNIDRGWVEHLLTWRSCPSFHCLPVNLCPACCSTSVV